jgi:hypothetical protein
MMGRWKKDGNHFPPNDKLVQIPTKQRETIPRNPMKPTTI